MFSEAQKSAYQSVKAPDSLRERVLNMATDAPQPKRRSYRRWLTNAVAACLALVVLSAALLHGGDTEILTGGTVIGGEPVAVGENSGVAMARAVNTLSVPLTAKPRGAVTFTPEDGVLKSADSRIAISAEIDSPAELIWEIENPDTAETYVLRVDCGDESSVLTLAFDAAENRWTVFAAQE